MLDDYRYVYAPDHPNAITKGWIAEHRLIAERTLGRYLERHEVVHHINGDKLDNSPENLQVMTASEHSKLHIARTH